MSWLKNNKPPENDDATWKVLYGTIEGKKMSVRVDTKFVDKKYANTYYVQVKYSDEPTTELPKVEFLKEIHAYEDKMDEIIQKTFHEHVVYLGCAIFGGSAYLTYASNFAIKWVEMISHYMGYKINGGGYLNDNMGYYNDIMYPEYLRNGK